MELQEDILKQFPILADHAFRSRNNVPLTDFNGHSRITGSCGDTMEFWLLVRDDKVERASFTTTGCGTSHACGSMATCLAQGLSVEQAALISKSDIMKSLDGLPAEAEHCALLAAETLFAACDNYLKETVKKEKDSSASPKTCKTCNDSSCSASQKKPEENDQDFEERQALESRLCRINRKIVVLSGKGGVGKSTVAVNLAVALMLSGKRVGLMDVDIHGPSIPTMLGLEGAPLQGSEGEILPVEMQGLKVMSIGFFLQDQDNAVIWRGPLKMGAIKQFLKDVAWGDLDFLIIDSPPGTGDEPLSVCQLIGKVDGAVIVTTPQKVAAVDVRKSITFCRQMNVPVLGVVENMSGFACPKCGEITSIFREGAGKRIAQDMHVPFLGSIPLDPQVAECGDNGRAFIQQYAQSPTAAVMRDIIKPIEKIL
jgi:Mrp family chromosome partitioning ATPase